MGSRSFRCLTLRSYHSGIMHIGRDLDAHVQGNKRLFLVGVLFVAPSKQR